jgi:hypothetical protein
MDVLPYSDVLASIGSGRTHLLLGNGFSIACDPIFSYSSLYERALAKGLSERAQAVFGRLGTNNFEGAMRLLGDAHWAAKTYGLITSETSAFSDDLEIIKATLIDAIAETHLDHPGRILDARKTAALTFLKQFHNVFCTNYDLLPHWINMFALPQAPFEDGFRGDPEDPDHGPLVFTEHLADKKGIFFIHGALHLYLGSGGVLKHSWLREGRRLTELVREGLAAGQYPLFVAEGTPERKLDQIRSSGYLSYCLSKFGRVEGRLVTFGHSLGSSDQHILDAISSNGKFTDIYLGVYGCTGSEAARQMSQVAARIADQRARLRDTRRSRKDLSITLFDTTTAAPWG